ncbi:hypothetical protein GCM10010431_60720 [Streptomyces kunmingensis]
MDEGEDEIAQQGDGHDEAHAHLDVRNGFGGHSLVTPLATRATSAKTAIMVTTKARSAIVSSRMRCERDRDGLEVPERVKCSDA